MNVFNMNLQLITNEQINYTITHFVTLTLIYRDCASQKSSNSITLHTLHTLHEDT